MAPQGSGSGEWLRLPAAAAAAGVSPAALRRRADAGDLPCYRRPGGPRFVRRRDAETLSAAAPFEAPGSAAEPPDGAPPRRPSAPTPAPCKTVSTTWPAASRRPSICRRRSISWQAACASSPTPSTATSGCPKAIACAAW